MTFQTWVQGFYVLASVFGLGVTAIDLLGILGSDDSDADGGHDVDGAHDGIDTGHAGFGDHGAGHEDIGGEIGAGGHVGDGHAGEVVIDGEIGVEHGDVPEGQVPAVHGSEDGNVPGQSTAGHSTSGHMAAGQASTIFATSLAILTYLRRAVYFSLGFGPVGLVAMLMGWSTLMSLVWAVPFGLVSAYVAGLIFSFQRSDVDSSVTSRDLFLQNADVLVPIVPGGMGKVRIQLGQSVVDRYAKSDEQHSFEKGERVSISRVTTECVYVERIRQ